MEFTMETTRMFLAVFIVVSIALAIVLFLLSGIGYLLRWLREVRERRSHPR